MATTITKPALVFVWPCFAQADTFLEEDPREVDRARDREMTAQYRRLREGFSGVGIEVLKASGALHIDFASERGRTEKVRTTTVEWRGVLVFCPGSKVKRIKMAEAILPDTDILAALGECTPASKAIGLFRRACDGGLAMGCFNVALLYRSGIGVPQDLSEATGFFAKACELANVLACQTVAVGYASGRGVPKDLGKAATFYEKACDGGWSPGCTNLAGLYLVGAGVEADPDKAKHFYAKGCKLGSKNACQAANR